MEMALDLGSALRLPDFVKNFTERVASMIGAKCGHSGLGPGQQGGERRLLRPQAGA